MTNALGTTGTETRTLNPEVESLLALQADDHVLDALEAKLAGLEPRARELDRARRGAEESLARARAAVEAEEKRHAVMQARVAEHTQLHTRNVQQLEAVRKMRDATAATAQVEQARQMLAAEESELETIGRRLGEIVQSACCPILAKERVRVPLIVDQLKFVGDQIV